MADLRTVLGDTKMSPEDRRRLAERAGRAVADLHRAGFGTPELAAKHLFANSATEAVSLVDWQSAGEPGPVSDADRARQLAGLDASLAADLASPRERLRFVRAYLRAVRPAPRFGAFVRTVAEQAVRLRGRSSARDQRLPPAPRLVWLAGEQVCVIPELADLWPVPAVCPPFYLDSPTPEEWVTFSNGRRALLTRFSTFDPLGRMAAAVRERPWRSPAATAARVLFHLHRHGVPAPNLLAFGQRCGPLSGRTRSCCANRSRRLSRWLSDSHNYRETIRPAGSCSTAAGRYSAGSTRPAAGPSGHASRSWWPPQVVWWRSRTRSPSAW